MGKAAALIGGLVVSTPRQPSRLSLLGRVTQSPICWRGLGAANAITVGLRAHPSDGPDGLIAARAGASRPHPVIGEVASTLVTLAAFGMIRQVSPARIANVPASIHALT
jgi:hypothetical protein